MPHFNDAKNAAQEDREEHWLFKGVMETTKQHDYEADRERLEKGIDAKISVECGIRHRGAMEFCDFLRGKVEANTLLIAWETFSKQQGFV